MKILVVDDEKDIQALFLQQFRKEIRSGEMEFAFAFSGEEALIFLEDSGQEAVLILSDILRRIKEKYKEPPPIVMMITAYGDNDNHQTAMHLGANDFLTKPLDLQQLLAVLHELLDGAPAAR